MPSDKIDSIMQSLPYSKQTLHRVTYLIYTKKIHEKDTVTAFQEG